MYVPAFFIILSNEKHHTVKFSRRQSLALEIVTLTRWFFWDLKTKSLNGLL